MLGGQLYRIPFGILAAFVAATFNIYPIQANIFRVIFTIFGADKSKETEVP